MPIIPRVVTPRDCVSPRVKSADPWVIGSTSVSQVIFLSLAVLFWMLSARDGLGWKGVWATATGVEGVFCGLSAIYGAMAQVLNENYGKTVLPLG